MKTEEFPPSFFLKIMAKNKETQTKFNVSKDVSKRTYNDITFASELEMQYYKEVVLPLHESGEIVHFELQKEYVLQPSFRHDGKVIRPIVYVADFYIEYKDGSIEVIDTKGYAEPLAEMKKKMFWYLFPDLPYKWLCFSKIDGGWCEYDVVKRNRAARRREKKKAKQKSDNNIKA